MLFEDTVVSKIMEDFNTKCYVMNIFSKSQLSMFSKSQLDRINKFVEALSYHFTPLDSLHDSITDTDDDSYLVYDVDPDTLLRIVRTELKHGQAPGIDNVNPLFKILDIELLFLSVVN